MGERERLEIDQPVRRLHVVLHQLHQVGAASEVSAAVRCAGGDRGIDGRGVHELEGLHGSGAPRHVTDGRDDVGICPTSTDVAAHPLADFGVGAGMAFVGQRHGRHDLAGHTVAALEAVMVQEGRLHRVEIAAGREALDGGDCLALAAHGESKAGDDSTAVDMHGAGAAGTAVAALLRAGEGRLFLQRIEQGGAGFDGQRQGRRAPFTCNSMSIWPEGAEVGALVSSAHAGGDANTGGSATPVAVPASSPRRVTPDVAISTSIPLATTL
jgi:hypothetical protein